MNNSKNFYEIILCMAIVVSLSFSYFGPEGDKDELKELDASQLKLEDVELIVSNGHGPSWSPDGKLILFDQGDPGNYLIKIMDIEKRTVEIITDGYGACWSPDGSRIAYFKWPKGSVTSRFGNKIIAIYDLKEKKEYILAKAGSYPPGVLLFKLIHWHPHEDILLFFEDIRKLEGPQDISVLDLDDLSWGKRKLSYGEITAMPPRFVIQIRTAFRISETLPREYFPSYLFDSSWFPFFLGQFNGIWAENKTKDINNMFAICLAAPPTGRGDHYIYMELSPDFSKLRAFNNTDFRL